MQTKMTPLQEAADYEARLAKLEAKHDAACVKAAERHAQKLLSMKEAHDDDVNALRDQYTTEGLATYDRNREAAE